MATYLEELQKTYPTYFYTNPPGVDTLGYSVGTRWDPILRDRAVHLSLGQSPVEEKDTRAHEGRHQLIDKSPNWSHIVQIQQPTKELHGTVGLTYPKALEVEENMIRHLGDMSLSANKSWADIAGGLSEIQKRLLPSLKSHEKYGPQWGSFVGPGYDERELREGKGQNILPKFVFNPSPEDRNVPGVFPRKDTNSPDFGLRPDGTKKGLGYFGPLPMTDKSGRVMTEYSIGVNLGDKEVLIPTLVPTLDKNELRYLLGGGTLNESAVGKRIFNKAVEHAKERLANGKSPFADEVQPELPNEEEKLETRGLYQPTWSSVSNE